MAFMEKCFMCYLLLWTVDIQNVHVNDVSMYFAKPYLEKIIQLLSADSKFWHKNFEFCKILA